ncbi:hypothetical protein PR202_ga16918 [Eleusine coracana subsp. coracana]|uniref:Uncharacterized protein n=1 Tax=Eleusine coracana subsp. coracana TaxID=191504 RepID=A0AAV5CPI3_ELECO|nr:hypothetical protein PR202_ga16918 [Eleusine coracana subsp. coracana]
MECSSLYLAITCEATSMRCERIRNGLRRSLFLIQNMVESLLANQVADIHNDLGSLKFIVDPAEEEAGKAILEMLRQPEATQELELQTFLLAASKLNLMSPKAILTERRAIKKLLDKISGTDPKKEAILKYFMYLVRKYGKNINTKNGPKKLNQNVNGSVNTGLDVSGIRTQECFTSTDSELQSKAAKDLKNVLNHENQIWHSMVSNGFLGAFHEFLKNDSGRYTMQALKTGIQFFLAFISSGRVEYCSQVMKEGVVPALVDLLVNGTRDAKNCSRERYWTGLQRRIGEGLRRYLARKGKAGLFVPQQYTTYPAMRRATGTDIEQYFTYLPGLAELVTAPYRYREDIVPEFYATLSVARNCLEIWFLYRGEPQRLTREDLIATLGLLTSDFQLYKSTYGTLVPPHKSQGGTLPSDEMVSIAFPPPHTLGFERGPTRLTAEAKVVRAIVTRTIIPQSGYREEFTLLHQWAVAAILRKQPFDLADLFIAEMEEVISERVRG